MKDDKVFADAADLELQIDMLEEFDANSDDKYNTLMICWLKELQQRRALQSGNSAQPVTVPAGYVLVPVDLLSDLRDFAHPEIEKYCEMWEGRRDSEFPAMRKIISDADALLAAAPKAPDGWIPVSERMPENNSYVSVVSRHGEYVSGLVNGEWLELHDGSSFPVSEIYLWLTLPCLPSKPLPDAPKVTP